MGNISGLMGGGGQAAGGMNASQQMTPQMAQQMQQANLAFQNQMNAMTKKNATLTTAQKQMHDQIVAMVNDIK